MPQICAKRTCKLAALHFIRVNHSVAQGKLRPDLLTCHRLCKCDSLQAGRSCSACVAVTQRPHLRVVRSRLRAEVGKENLQCSGWCLAITDLAGLLGSRSSSPFAAQFKVIACLTLLCHTVLSSVFERVVARLQDRSICCQVFKIYAVFFPPASTSNSEKGKHGGKMEIL